MKFAVALALCLVSTPAVAQQTCESRNNVLKNLFDKWGEKPIGQGEALNDSGQQLELLVSPGGETWTIILSSPDGKSCLFLAGKNWTPPPGHEL